VGIVNLEKTAVSNGDSVGKDGEVQSTGVFGGGVFDPGDATGIIGKLAQQLRGGMRRCCPGAGHFLRSRAKGS